MPVVLRVDGFQFHIFLPPREHGPAHVHVIKGGGRVTILLGMPAEGVSVRDVQGMRTSDVVAAVKIAQDHIEELREHWRQYHG